MLVGTEERNLPPIGILATAQDDVDGSTCIETIDEPAQLRTPLGIEQLPPSQRIAMGTLGRSIARRVGKTDERGSDTVRNETPPPT